MGAMVGQCENLGRADGPVKKVSICIMLHKGAHYGLRNEGAVQYQSSPTVAVLK